MTTRGPSHGLDADQLEEAIAFLATAPKGVEPWATQQTEALQKRLAEVTDEPECFYDDFEDEDDVLSSRKAREKLVGDEPEKMPKGFKLVLAVVLIVGLVVGIWLAGRPAGTQTAGAGSAGTVTMGSSPESTESADDRLVVLERMVEDDPDDMDARLELGANYFNRGWISDAEEQWAYVAEADPDNVMAWYNLGFVYLAQEPSDTARAMEMRDKVIELEPDSELADTILTHMGGLIVEEQGVEEEGGEEPTDSSN